jgi:hypothetical protein
MAFLCTFSGLTISLIVWVGLYTLASSSGDPTLNALAPYLEALSITGQLLFVVLAALFSLLAYRLLRPRAGDGSSEKRED